MTDINPYYTATDGEWEEFRLDILFENLQTCYCRSHYWDEENTSAFKDIIRYPDYYFINGKVYKPTFSFVKFQKPKNGIIPVFLEDELSVKNTDLFSKYYDLALHAGRFYVLTADMYRGRNTNLFLHDTDKILYDILDKVIEKIRKNDSLNHGPIDIRLIDEYNLIWEEDGPRQERFELRAHNMPSVEHFTGKAMRIDMTLKCIKSISEQEALFFSFDVLFSLNKRHHYKINTSACGKTRIGETEPGTENIVLEFSDDDRVNSDRYPKSLAMFLDKTDPADVQTTIAPHCENVFPIYATMNPPAEIVRGKTVFMVIKMVIRYGEKEFVIV